jgi:hypothetical protein
MRWKFGAGILLLIAGLALALHYESAFRMSSPEPIDVPISLSANHISYRFRAPVDARYRVGVGFQDPQKLAFEKPNCMPLPSYPKDDCSGIPSSFDASWVLLDGDRVAARGKASNTIWRVSGRPFLDFYVFHAEAGRQYKLDVDVISADAAHLVPAKPRLQVFVWEPEYDRDIWSATHFALFKLSFRLLYFLCVLVGFGLIAASILRRDDASS